MTTLRTMRALDGRTSAAKAAKLFARRLTEALGGSGNLSPVQQLAIERAARMDAISSDLEARHMGGERVSIDDLVRCRRLCRQIVADLGITPAPQPEAPAPAPSSGEDAIAIIAAAREKLQNGG